jgi:PAS domain S-box-containing protein
MAAVHPTRDAAVSDDSGRFYRLIADTIPLMVWSARADGAVDYVNQRVLDYTGLGSPELEGWRWEEIIHPEDRERCTLVWKRSLERGERAENDMRLRRADGEYRWHHGSGLPLRDADGRITRWFGICTDIEAEERMRALGQSEQRFRSFMEHAPAAAWVKDGGLRYTYVNRTYENFYGRAASQVLGREDFELHAPALARFFREDDEKILRSGKAAQRMHEVPYADGRPAHWLVTKFPLLDSAGRTGIGGIGIDITPRLEAEDKARRYADEIRSLVGRLVQAQEAERRRVADDLHDLIGQNLTVLGIDLQALKQRLQSAGDALAVPRLDAMAALLDSTVDAIRGVMTDLRPPALEEFGLVPALRWHASQFSKRTGIKVTTKAPRREARLPPETELALFRIVQEALTNAAKHSGAAAVEIRLRYGAGATLSVQDDGRGFAEPRAARGDARPGFGLTAMRERAEAQGGTLRVEFPQRGTRVVVEIPEAPRDD